MRFFRISLLCLGVLLFTACRVQDGQKTTTTEAVEQLPVEQGDQEITEIGLVKSVEDSGYPFYTLEIEFPERKFSEYFTVNLADLSELDPQKLSAMAGKYVQFEYTSTLTYALLDVRQDNTSVLGLSPSELPDGLKEISGTLSGASEPTQGDLPTTIRIHDPEGLSLQFEFFVTPELTEAEGELVVGYYDERTANKIISIRLTDK